MRAATGSLSPSATVLDGQLLNVTSLPLNVTVTSPNVTDGLAPTVQGVISGVLLSLIILFTLIGNGLVVTAVVNFQRLRSVTNYFVVSLAVADLTVAILVMPYALVYELYSEWKFGWQFCYFWISCDVTCCTASILHLCVISLDRYLAITQPLIYKTRMSKRRAIQMICGVWICSGAISFVPIYMGWFADPEQVTLYTDSPDCGLYVNRIYAVISSATSFYIPLFVMVIVYVKIYKIARRQAEEIKRLEMQVAKCEQMIIDNDGTRLQRRSKRVRRDAKAIKTLGTLMGLFCVSWLPFFLMYVILPFCNDCYLPPLWLSAITWLGYANSFINPCVYAFLNKDFRLAFKKILLCGRTRFCCGGLCPCSRRAAAKRDMKLRKNLQSGVYEYVLADTNVVSNGNGTLVALHSKASGSTLNSLQLDKCNVDRRNADNT